MCFTEGLRESFNQWPQPLGQRASKCAEVISFFRGSRCRWSPLYSARHESGGRAASIIRVCSRTRSRFWSIEILTKYCVHCFASVKKVGVELCLLPDAVIAEPNTQTKNMLLGNLDNSALAREREWSVTRKKLPYSIYGTRQGHPFHG